MPDLPPILLDLLLLLVRALLTAAFVHECLLKAKDIRAFAKNDGVPVPLAWVVAVCEGAAAISFATGILAPWAGLGVIVLMLITTSMQIFRWHSPFWAQRGGPEYDLMLLTLAAVVLLLGPGAFSIPGLLAAL